MKERIENIIQNHLYIGKSILEDKELINNIWKVSYAISDYFNGGHKLLIFGNGGSAGDSQHIAGELVGKFKLERKALPVMALTTDTSVITSLSNDSSFDYIFSRQVEAHAKRNDILWGISTSGNSKNVLEAFKTGRGIGTYNIALTGNDGGEIKKSNLANLIINVPSNDTPRIQEYHTLIYHTICELVEGNFKK